MSGPAPAGRADEVALWARVHELSRIPHHWSAVSVERIVQRERAIIAQLKRIAALKGADR